MSSRASSTKDEVGLPRDRSPQLRACGSSYCASDKSPSSHNECATSSTDTEQYTSRCILPKVKRFIQGRACATSRTPNLLLAESSSAARPWYHRDAYRHLESKHTPHIPPFPDALCPLEDESLRTSADLKAAGLPLDSTIEDMRRSINVLVAELVALKQAIFCGSLCSDSELLLSRQPCYNRGKTYGVGTVGDPLGNYRRLPERQFVAPGQERATHGIGQKFYPITDKTLAEVHKSSSDLSRYNNSNTDDNNTHGPSTYPLPEDPTATDVISIWQNGTSNIPPVRLWSADEMRSQRDKLLSWYRIYRTFTDKFDGDLRKFSVHFPATLPITHAVFANSSFDEDFRQILDGEKCQNPTGSISLLSLSSSTGNWWTTLNNAYPIHWNESANRSHGQCFVLPRKLRGRKVTAKDVIQLWDFGLGDIPPISLWTPAQKLRQQSKISRWKKIVDIFRYECGSDMQIFEEKYSNENGQMLAVAAIISKYEEAHSDISNITIRNTDFPTMTDGKPFSNGSYSASEDYQHDTGIPEDCKQSGASSQIQGLVDAEADSSASSEDFEVLYNNPIGEMFKTFTVLEAIQLWEKGSGTCPPVRQWTYMERAEHQGTVEAIERIYSIYSEVFQRDHDGFSKACHDENKILYAPKDFIEKFKVHIDRIKVISHATPMIVSSMTFDSSHRHLISRDALMLHILPRKIEGRKVNARDVLTLWNLGMNNIPPIKSWTPRQKAKQQSKISRWKKVVDIIEQDFGGDLETFEKHFSTPLGELLPISAIISRYELDRFIYHNQNCPP